MRTLSLLALAAWILIGLVIEHQYAERRAAERIARVKAIAESNLVKAEINWISCKDGLVWNIDDDIYVGREKKTIKARYLDGII